jgi:hypothetical protein
LALKNEYTPQQNFKAPATKMTTTEPFTEIWQKIFPPSIIKLWRCIGVWRQRSLHYISQFYLYVSVHFPAPVALRLERSANNFKHGSLWKLHLFHLCKFTGYWL